MKVRPHRGSLRDSMAAAVDIEPTMAALVEVVRKDLEPWGVTVTPDKVTLQPVGYDERIGWDTHFVRLGGCNWGMTDGPLADACATPALC